MNGTTAAAARPAKEIRARDRGTIIQALSAGMVPRNGLAHIQVGRAAEIAALLRDVDRIADGGASVRFVIGEYGAGKTFFASLVRMIALERKCITMHADLTPERRIHASGGQARALYSEAVKSMSSRSKPDGGALASVVERLIADAMADAKARGVAVEDAIEARLAPIREFAGGYDFATVLKAYWRGSETGDEDLKTGALRWLRGEFSTKTEARQVLGVRTIIDDGNIYASLKTMSGLVRIAGYAGLLVMFDEMVNIYKLTSPQARAQNYEQILAILNDGLQGSAAGIGFVMCGTPEFLLDTRRGLYSYDALQSRLAENRFATGGLVDLSGPVIKLQNLTPEDLLVLLHNIREVFASGDPAAYLLPDAALTAFMEHCNRQIGEAYFKTPRTTVKAFVQLLSVLEQNEGADWKSLLGGVAVEKDEEGSQDMSGETGGTASTAGAAAADDELASLRV